jgi:DNA modification methylase
MNQTSTSSGSELLRNRTLYFGDNLRVLREKFPHDEGYFDLIYLDPPFNSNRNYNVLFKEGIEDSPAQIHAFEDTWHWTKESQEQFDDLVQNTSHPQKVSELMQGLEKLIGHNDMLAYLTMMTVRLIELHRVLKATGSIYLHCDPTASHYLKLVMDATFGIQNFRNEIIWHYSGWNAKLRTSFNGRHDVILYYSKTDDVQFNSYAEPWKSEEEYLQVRKQKVHIEDGRRYVLSDAGGGKRVKRYLEEAMTYGKPVDDVWDIDKINNSSKEALGYPTQKPQKLLERIVQASSQEGDWVLDPFGGCGTTTVAAEKLKRNWCIIDITTLSINLVKRRIEDMYPDKELDLIVDGLPADIGGATALFQRDPFEFEYWCCDLVQARPAGDKTKGKMKGADRGIDGIITFIDRSETGSITSYRKLLVQVKGGHVKSGDVRDFRGTIEREKAAGGIFICLEAPSKPMIQESIEAGSYVYNLTENKYPVIQILTVGELLEGKKPDHPSTAISYAKQAEKVKVDNQQSMF